MPSFGCSELGGRARPTQTTRHFARGPRSDPQDVPGESLPQSWNRCSYVLNNPLQYTDASGLYCYYGDPNSSTDSFDNSQYDFHSAESECTTPDENGNAGLWFPDSTDSVTVTAGPLPDPSGIGSWLGNFINSFKSLDLKQNLGRSKSVCSEKCRSVVQ